MKKPSLLRRSSGVVAALLLALSWFSPMQVTLRELPDTLALTQGQVSTLRLGGLTLSGKALTVTSSQDETLASLGVVDVSAQTSGSADMLLSALISDAFAAEPDTGVNEAVLSFTVNSFDSVDAIVIPDEAKAALESK